MPSQEDIRSMTNPSAEAERLLAEHAAVSHRDTGFADWLVLTIQLAAYQRPEALRTALASVFDLTAIEEQNRRMLNVLADIQAKYGEAKALIEELYKELEDMERNRDALLFEIAMAKRKRA